MSMIESDDPARPEPGGDPRWFGQPAGRPRFTLVPVRRRDVRRLQQAGPPVGEPLPARHATEPGDPRYPSPRDLRRTIGVGLDLVLHLGGAAAVGLAFSRLPDGSRQVGSGIAAAVGAFLALSILHRVLVQWVWQTTLGKAAVGLCQIRDDTGGRPTFWSLVKAWVVGAFTAVATIMSGP